MNDNGESLKITLSIKGGKFLQIYFESIEPYYYLRKVASEMKGRPNSILYQFDISGLNNNELLLKWFKEMPDDLRSTGEVKIGENGNEIDDCPAEALNEDVTELLFLPETMMVIASAVHMRP